MDSYFFKKKVTSLSLKVGGALGEPKRGRGCIIINVLKVAMGGINIDSEGVLGPRVLPFKRLLNIYY
jgi:hypothetical protein